MSAFTVARTPVAVRVNARTQVSRRNVSVKAANDIYEGETAFWTSKSGAAMRGTAAEYEAAKESGDTYLASTVSGVLPSWAAAAGADSDKVYGIQNVIASPFQILEGSNFIASGPELMNGRAAMMGISGMLIHESLTGNPVWPIPVPPQPVLEAALDDVEKGPARVGSFVLASLGMAACGAAAAIPELSKKQ